MPMVITPAIQLIGSALVGLFLVTNVFLSYFGQQSVQLKVTKNAYVYNMVLDVDGEKVPTKVPIPKDKKGNPKGVKIAYKKKGEDFELTFEHGEEPFTEFEEKLIREAFDTIQQNNRSTFQKIIGSKPIQKINDFLNFIYDKRMAKRVRIIRGG